MTLKQIILDTSKELQKKKIKEPLKEAEALISLAINFTPSQLILNSQTELNSFQIKNIKKILKKRLQAWPLAYLSGKKNFYNLEFIVNKNTLIPRPESELIIDQILKENFFNKKTTIIDIGTGSGCLIISLANIFRTNKNIYFYGTDISRPALNIAKINAKKYQLNKRIIFLKGDLLKPILKKIKKNLNHNQIIIIANLPYLTKKEIKNSPSIQKEPFKSLYGGNDGLKYYKQLLDQIKDIKTKENNIILYQEINDWQKDKLESLIMKKIGILKPQIATLKDLAGYNRLTITRF
ncbi:MAG TPA: peptide chain release factor N(5)-glutamine methyltransferase [bacterium]|nr:peptide chain release factor N(5)-glutamine methyltransferase [bacterium]